LIAKKTNTKKIAAKFNDEVAELTIVKIRGKYFKV